MNKGVPQRHHPFTTTNKMRYFLIAGEASGDLHASELMKALKAADPEAEFAFYGGDCMAAVGGTLLRHYKDLAYMGFIPVLLHLRTILQGMADCKRQIAEWQPDALILVDYPGFNLKMARFVHDRAICPVFYYISPKIWAWKERRIKDIRRNVDRLFSILPFEIDFFEKKHHYPISYVGNPTVDEVTAFCAEHGQPQPDGRTVALLPGSRRQEILDNLPTMLRSAEAAGKGDAAWEFCVACAPAIPDELYREAMQKAEQQGFHSADKFRLIRGGTYELLHRATTALVTSGTATLETALFGVPQIVCYYIPLGPVIRLARRLFLKVPYISLVNLVCGREVVPELVASDMNAARLTPALRSILPGGEARDAQLKGYAEMRRLLGEPGAPQHAAREMVEILHRK